MTPSPVTMMTTMTKGINMPKQNEPAKAKQLAEFKYIGDDGGRWLFERRSDGLCFTIDKPRGIVLDHKTPPMSCRLTVRGKTFNPEVLGMVRR